MKQKKGSFYRQAHHNNNNNKKTLIFVDKQTSWNQSYIGCLVLCGCQDLNSGHLEEQIVLLTSLQPLFISYASPSELKTKEQLKDKTLNYETGKAILWIYKEKSAQHIACSQCNNIETSLEKPYQTTCHLDTHKLLRSTNTALVILASYSVSEIKEV